MDQDLVDLRDQDNNVRINALLSLRQRMAADNETFLPATFLEPLMPLMNKCISSSHTALSSTALDTLPSLFEVLSSKQPSMYRNVMVQLLPPIIDRLGDLKPLVRQKAIDTLILLWKEAYNASSPSSSSMSSNQSMLSPAASVVQMFEREIRLKAFQHRSPRVREGSIEWLYMCSVGDKRLTGFLLRPYIPVLVRCLDDSAEAARAAARNTLINIVKTIPVRAAMDVIEEVRSSSNRGNLFAEELTSIVGERSGGGTISYSNNTELVSAASAASTGGSAAVGGSAPASFAGGSLRGMRSNDNLLATTSNSASVGVGVIGGNVSGLRPPLPPFAGGIARPGSSLGQRPGSSLGQHRPGSSMGHHNANNSNAAAASAAANQSNSSRLPMRRPLPVGSSSSSSNSADSMVKQRAMTPQLQQQQLSASSEQASLHVSTESLPPMAFSTPEVKVTNVLSAKSIEQEFTSAAQAFVGKEDESNWTERERFITKLREIIRGNAGTEHTSILVNLVKSHMESILKALNTLRTTMAMQTLYLISDLFVVARNKADVLQETIISSLLGICAGTKKIVIQAAIPTAVTVAKCGLYHSKIGEILLKESGEKMPSLKQAILAIIKGVLQVHLFDPVDNFNDLEVFNKILIKLLVDASPVVREPSREVYWIIKHLYPNIADNLLGKLDASVQKQINKDQQKYAALKNTLNPTVPVHSNSSSGSVNARSASGLLSPGPTRQPSGPLSPQMNAANFRRPQSAMANVSPAGSRRYQSNDSDQQHQLQHRAEIGTGIRRASITRSQQLPGGYGGSPGGGGGGGSGSPAAKSRDAMLLSSPSHIIRQTPRLGSNGTGQYHAGTPQSLMRTSPPHGFLAPTPADNRRRSSPAHHNISEAMIGDESPLAPPMPAFRLHAQSSQLKQQQQQQHQQPGSPQAPRSPSGLRSPSSLGAHRVQRPATSLGMSSNPTPRLNRFGGPVSTSTSTSTATSTASSSQAPTTAARPRVLRQTPSRLGLNQPVPPPSSSTLSSRLHYQSQQQQSSQRAEATPMRSQLHHQQQQQQLHQSVSRGGGGSGGGLLFNTNVPGSTMRSGLSAMAESSINTPRVAQYATASVGRPGAVTPTQSEPSIIAIPSTPDNSSAAALTAGRKKPLMHTPSVAMSDQKRVKSTVNQKVEVEFGELIDLDSVEFVSGDEEMDFEIDDDDIDRNSNSFYNGGGSSRLSSSFSTIADQSMINSSLAETPMIMKAGNQAGLVTSRLHVPPPPSLSLSHLNPASNTGRRISSVGSNSGSIRRPSSPASRRISVSFAPGSGSSAASPQFTGLTAPRRSIGGTDSKVDSLSPKSPQSPALSATKDLVDDSQLPSQTPGRDTLLSVNPASLATPDMLSRGVFALPQYNVNNATPTSAILPSGDATADNFAAMSLGNQNSEGPAHFGPMMTMLKTRRHQIQLNAQASPLPAATPDRNNKLGEYVGRFERFVIRQRRQLHHALNSNAADNSENVETELDTFNEEEDIKDCIRKLLRASRDISPANPSAHTTWGSTGADKYAGMLSRVVHASVEFLSLGSMAASAAHKDGSSSSASSSSAKSKATALQNPVLRESCTQLLKSLLENQTPFWTPELALLVLPRLVAGKLDQWSEVSGKSDEALKMYVAMLPPAVALEPILALIEHEHSSVATAAAAAAAAADNQDSDAFGSVFEGFDTDLQSQGAYLAAGFDLLRFLLPRLDWSSEVSSTVVPRTMSATVSNVNHRVTSVRMAVVHFLGALMNISAKQAPSATDGKEVMEQVMSKLTQPQRNLVQLYTKNTAS
ncbi:hypothetical protein GQ42DRAFT_42436 [Ramicandelaber brevisporus]|nr:hypothetical protein GQ42DRAFT_42436 [Ramicandelaber brevisporus]